MTTRKTLDILTPRPNPEIPLLLRIIEESGRELQAEQDFTCRRGRAAILMAHLRALIDEPETVSGASQPGVVNDDQHWFTADEMPEVDRFTSERPFDKAGPSSDLFFFHTDTGKFSPLYRAPAHDPYHVRVLWSYGTYVHTLERTYVTEPPTSMHAGDARVCERLLAAEGFELSGNPVSTITLFIDPKGCSSPMAYSGFMVARFEDPAIAERAADFLAACLGVRFMVAARRYTLCTR